MGAVAGIFVLIVIMFNTALNRLESHVLKWRPPGDARAGGEMQ